LTPYVSALFQAWVELGSTGQIDGQTVAKDQASHFPKHPSPLSLSHSSSTLLTADQASHFPDLFIVPPKSNNRSYSEQGSTSLTKLEVILTDLMS
jgi:hypothetical protein